VDQGPHATTPTPRTWPTTLALALATLLVCRLFTTGIWHGLDAYQFLARIEQGLLHHDRHPLYPFVAHGIARALAALGMPWFDAVVFASTLGTAAGVAFVHRALLALSLPRTDATAAAAAVAGSFGVLYYGTVIEIHGVFFAFAGAAWWAFAAWQRRAGAARALALGAATGVAACAHATGHLLPFTFAALALAWRRSGMPLRRLALGLALAALAHFAAAAALSRLIELVLASLDQLPAAPPQPFDGTTRYLDRMLSLGTDWSTTPGVLWREWLRPFLPCSVLALCAWRADLRRATAALLCCVAVYLAAAVILLSPASTVARPQYVPPFATIEYGAYFLPLAVPAAVLSLQQLPARARLLLPAAALACGLFGLFFPDRAAGDPAYARDALQCLDETRGRLICGGYGEHDPILRQRPGAWYVVSVYALQVLIAGRAEGTPYEFVTGYFDSEYAKAEAAGGALLVTEDALRLMRETRDGLLDRLADEHIPAHYELLPVEHGRFRALRARRKG
jgi:hypothetical protein